MIDMFITIVIVYLAYYFISVLRFDKYGHVKKNKSNKNNKNGDKLDDYMALPVEAKYFIKKYNIDLEKVNLRGILNLIGVILGIDIAIISLFVLLVFDKVVWQVLIASILIFPIYLLSIKIAGNYFKKKGLVKNV
ncbi:MAG: hypothetical protein J6A52_07125 [Bacilli bacterium]|nr:hypothetical protein [Bacilli bacterium]